MKVFALLCLIGLAASSGPLPFAPQTQYTFQYEGRLLSGIPELATHFSGLGIKCQVQVQVSSDGQRIGIQIQSPQYVRVNQKLGPAPSQGGQPSSQVLNNWRLVQLPSYQPVPGDHLKYLQTPVVFQVTPTGEFRSMQVDQQQPEWSVNFKKALVYLFQTNFQQAPIPGMVENQVIPSGGDQPENYINYYETEEQGLDGICKVTYQINQLPEYMIKENPDKVPLGNQCTSRGQGSVKYYEILKTKDVSTCRKRTSFSYYKPGFFSCPYGGNCDGMWAKSSTTRYVACGPRQGQLTLQSILNEGELQQNLLGYKSEKFLTGTRQQLKLQSVQKMSNDQPRQPQNAIQVDDLFFEYFFKNKVNGGSTDERMSRTVPRNILTSGTIGGDSSSSNTEELKKQIVKIVEELVNEDLKQTVNVAEKQVTMKALSLARAFTMLNQENIDQVYGQLKSKFSSNEQKKQMFKNIFFDALLMGGSTDNVLYIVQKAQKNEISQSQLLVLLTSLPQYVLTPTPVVLNQLYELITSQQIQQSPSKYSHAILGFSTLIQKACLAPNRVSSYPTYVFGNFCNPDSQIVYGKWIPYLQKQLYQAQTPEQRNLILVAFAQLSHKSILPAVLPYIERTQPDLPGPNFIQPGQQNSTLFTRSLGIYALGQTGHQYPQIILPILFSVFSNQGENPEVRIAALQTIIRINPPLSYLQRIASTTWHERNIEVLQVVNTIFYSLSQQQDLEQLQGVYNSLQRNAWLVYPLIKRTGGRIPSSGSFYYGEYIKGLGVGYVQNNAWVNGQSTGMPNSLYQRVTYYLDRFQFNPLEVGLRVQNYQSLLQQIIEIIYPSGSSSTNGEGTMYDRLSEGIHEEWGKVMKKLNIKDRQGQQAQGALYVNLMENFKFFYNLQSSSSGELKEKIEKFLSKEPEMKKLLQGQQEFNYQRLINLSPYEASIPSDMGFPIVVEVHMPVVMSIKGESQNQIMSRSNPQVNFNVQTLLASQYTGWVGTVLPFTNEFVVTGIDKHLVVNVPVQFQFQIDVQQQQITIEGKPIPQQQGQQSEIDLVHYHVKPYTVYQKLYNLEPMTLNTNAQTIDSSSQTQTKQLPISQYFGGLMGFNLKTVVQSQTPFLDLRTVAQKMQLANNNPFNLFRFMLFDGGLTQSGKPSLRKHEVKLRYVPEGSNTQSVKAQIKFSFLSKKLGESLMGHMLEKSSSSPMPFIVSKEVESMSGDSLHHKVKPLFSGYRSGKGLGVGINVVLNGGGRPRTFSYNLNFINGLNTAQMQEKFNIQLESQQNNQKFCFDGQINMPQQTPAMDIDQIRTHPFKLNFQSTFGYGQGSCDQSKVTIQGQTKASQSTKEFSRNSSEGRRYRRMEEEGVPMYKYSDIAEKVRDQASFMDEVDVTVEYHNVPQQSITYQFYQYLVNFVRGRYWSNVVESGQILPPQKPQQQGQVTLKHQYTITLQPYTQSVNLTIQSDQSHGGQGQQRLRIQNVALPYPVGYVYPFPGIRTGPGSLLRLISGGGSFSPVCTVQGNHINGYNNQTRELTIDNCFHLLTGECGVQRDFAVLVKEQRRQGPKEVKVYLKHASIELRPTSSHTRYNTHVQVIVNGQSVQLQQGQPKVIKNQRHQQVATAQLTPDNQVQIDSPQIQLVFNGQDIQIQAQSQAQQVNLCGLCGSTSGPISGPEKCVYSRPELLEASYRIEGMPEGCKSLDRQIKEELEKERRKCVKVEDSTTKVWSSYKSSGDNRCTLHRHEIMDKHIEICFSRKPTTQCGQSCHPQGKVTKEVSFTCMGKGRVSERYERKIRNGEILPELQNLQESFKVKMELPRSCERY